jgi:hypothetical protein
MIEGRITLVQASPIAPDKHIFALDSYEGFPEAQISAKDTSWLRPEWKLPIWSARTIQPFFR